MEGGLFHLRNSAEQGLIVLTVARAVTLVWSYFPCHYVNGVKKDGSQTTVTSPDH